MGISIAEFRVAMETYGAKRLPDRAGSRTGTDVPCFAIGDVLFLHSGSYYIVQQGNNVPKEIMNKAMAEFGEEHPGRKNFWWGETHSVKGILTLVAMLEGKYNKELIDELTNKTYKKLLECSLIQKNVELPFQCNHSPKMEKLCQKVVEYNNIVNLFGNATFDLKEPIEYFDSLKLSIASFKESDIPYARLTLEGKSSQAKYDNDSNGWCYDTMILVQKNRKNGYIIMGHYYNNGRNYRPVDEVVRLDYKSKSGSYDHDPDDIDLRISLKTGMAWQTYKEEEAAPATDEQINIMITHLNKSIKKIKKRIIRYMINK